MGRGVMLDRITDSRARLFAALQPLMDDGRVRQYVPAQVVSPCVWIERHAWQQRAEGRAFVVVASWSVVILHDGETEEAQAWTDEMSAKVHDAALRAGFRPQTARHQTVDVGGTTTTGLVVTVDDVLAASTLCPPAPPPIQPITANENERLVPA